MGSRRLTIGFSLIYMSLNKNSQGAYSGGKVSIVNNLVVISFFLKRKSNGHSRGRKSKKSAIPTEEGMRLSFQKTRKKVANIIKCNVWQWFRKNGKPYSPIFLTLTFRDPVTDITIANRYFSEFFQNYNYRLFKKKDKILQYIAVPEFQKNGRVHFHVLIFNLPFNKRNHKIAEEVWKHGMINMKVMQARSSKNLSSYLTKYMLKNSNDLKMYNKRKYFCSLNVLKPIELNSYFLANSILTSLKKTKYSSEIERIDIECPFVGIIKYYTCKLDKFESILDLELDSYTKNRLESEINKENGKRLI